METISQNGLIRQPETWRWNLGANLRANDMPRSWHESQDRLDNIEAAELDRLTEEARCEDEKAARYPRSTNCREKDGDS